MRTRMLYKGNNAGEMQREVIPEQSIYNNIHNLVDDLNRAYFIKTENIPLNEIALPIYASLPVSFPMH